MISATASIEMYVCTERGGSQSSRATYTSTTPTWGLRRGALPAGSCVFKLQLFLPPPTCLFLAGFAMVASIPLFPPSLPSPPLLSRWFVPQREGQPTEHARMWLASSRA